MRDNIKIVRFYGIDSWNRPVFKCDGYKSFYGSTEILCDHFVDEWEVLKKVSEKDLTWFGNYFDCEPMGSDSGKIMIKRREE